MECTCVDMFESAKKKKKRSKIQDVCLFFKQNAREREREHGRTTGEQYFAVLYRKLSPYENVSIFCFASKYKLYLTLSDRNTANQVLSCLAPVPISSVSQHTNKKFINASMQNEHSLQFSVSVEEHCKVCLQIQSCSKAQEH